MSSKVGNIALSLLPFAALALAPFLGLGAIGAMLLVGGASLAGSLITKESMPTSEVGDTASLRVNARTTQKTIPLVYGKTRIGSNDVFIEMTGTDKKSLWIVHCLGEGICEGLELDPETDSKPYIYIDGQKLYSTAEYVSPFEGLVEWWFHNGDPTLAAPVSSGDYGGNQEVNAALNSAVPEFVDRMIYTAYIVFKIEFDTTVFTNIPTREVILKGQRIYDFRDLTTGYNRNPVLVLYDYITNTRYGLGWDPVLLDADSPLSSWVVAANYCDNHDPSWKIDVGIGSQLKSQDIIDMLLSHFRGGLNWFGGLLKIFYKDATTEVAAITDADIARGDDGMALIKVSQPSSHFTPSSVIVKYISESAAWTVDDISIGEEEGQLKRIDFMGFTSKTLAANMANYALERMRLNRAITVTLRASNIYLETGDVISMSSSELGLDDARMRVVASNILPNELTQLSLVYDDETLYNDLLDPFDTTIYENNLANPDEPPGPVRNVTITETQYVDRNRTFASLSVDFDPPDENSVYYKNTDISIRKGEEGIWGQSFRVTEKFELDNVTLGERYYISFKTVNIREVIQETATVVSYLVNGLSTYPVCPDSLLSVVNITSVNLYASPTFEADIEYYEFRMGQVLDSWNNSVFLTTMPLPALSYSGVKPGTHQFAVSPYRNDGAYCALPPVTTVFIETPPPYHTTLGSWVQPFDCGAGTCTNTEIDGSGYLKCSHINGSLYGTYHSPPIVIPLPVPVGVFYLAYMDIDYDVVGVGDTWTLIYPSPPPTTWQEGSAPPVTWGDLVGLSTQASKLDVRLWYDDGVSLSGSIPGMEIFSGLFAGPIVSFSIYITDVSNSSYLTVKPPTLVVCERT